MRDVLLKLMPEFNLIADRALREMTIMIWIDAVNKGGWTEKDLSEMPFTLLIQKTPVNLIEHTRAVTLTSLKIGEVMKEAYGDRIAINRDFLLSGSLLHDVGKLFEYRREAGKFVQSRDGKLLRHPISGAAFAYQYGLPQEIIHCIAAHSKEGDGTRRTVEAIIINHADFVNFDALKD
jgi:putative nucleotidyltransferase with HDIG domain